MKYKNKDIKKSNRKIMKTSNAPKWGLICTVGSIFIFYISTVNSAEDRYTYAKQQKYQNDYKKQPYEQQPEISYQRRNQFNQPQQQQPQQGFISNNNNNRGRQYQGGEEQNPRNVNLRSRGTRPQQNGPVPHDQNPKRCTIWIPLETVDKYPYASKIQVDASRQMQLIETCCKGYGQMRWRGSTICRPLCENCQNGFCVAPEKCECFDGFVPNDNGDCVFTCPLGCLNGHCYLDGTCHCDVGYKLDETRKYCRPICTGGCGQNERHNCTEPEVCTCSKGYHLTDTGCEPTCEPECGIGGQCRDANLCECNPGYMLTNGVCQAECYQECTNGFCYSKNRCICNSGFTYHERSTECIPI